MIPSITISRDIPMHIKRRGVETRMVIGNTHPERTSPILIKNIARARRWHEEFSSGTHHNPGRACHAIRRGQRLCQPCAVASPFFPLISSKLYCQEGSLPTSQLKNCSGEPSCRSIGRNKSVFWGIGKPNGLAAQHRAWREKPKISLKSARRGISPHQPVLYESAKCAAFGV